MRAVPRAANAWLSEAWLIEAGVSSALAASGPVHPKPCSWTDPRQHCTRVTDNVQRLKTRAQFQAVLAGTTLARTPHFALHCTALDTHGANYAAMQAPTNAAAATPATLRGMFEVDDVWLGAMVPKRWAKRAVTRNTIKRQIYSVADGFGPGLKNAAHVVRLRAGFDKKKFPSATSDVLKEAVRLELKLLLTKAVESS
jgi:ribonuclease P protein component